MKEHSADWDMETIREAALICSNTFLNQHSNFVWHDTVIDEVEYKIKEFETIIEAKQPKRQARFLIGEAIKRIEKFKKWKTELSEKE